MDDLNNRSDFYLVRMAFWSQAKVLIVYALKNPVMAIMCVVSFYFAGFAFESYKFLNENEQLAHIRNWTDVYMSERLSFYLATLISVLSLGFAALLAKARPAQ